MKRINITKDLKIPSTDIILEKGDQIYIKENQVKEGMGFHVKDDVFSGITYEELIDTVYSNYGSNAGRLEVISTYRDLVRVRGDNAVDELKDNMDIVLSNIRE